jgi:AbrB family looped-hinge helix DNA binding protein
MMNARSKISSKGQVVVPKDIRDRLGLAEGSEVEFVEKSDGVTIRRIMNTDRRFPPITAEQFLAGRYKHTGKPVSVEDMNRAIEVEARRMWIAENN